MTGELPDDMTEVLWDRLLDTAAVRKRCGRVSRQTMKRWRDTLGFPHPLDLPNVTGELWDAQEVDAWYRVHVRALEQTLPPTHMARNRA